MGGWLGIASLMNLERGGLFTSWRWGGELYRIGRERGVECEVRWFGGK